jgi:hypothetical protein
LGPSSKEAGLGNSSKEDAKANPARQSVAAEKMNVANKARMVQVLYILCEIRPAPKEGLCIAAWNDDYACGACHWHGEQRRRAAAAECCVTACASWNFDE